MGWFINEIKWSSCSKKMGLLTNSIQIRKILITSKNKSFTVNVFLFVFQHPHAKYFPTLHCVKRKSNYGAWNAPKRFAIGIIQI